MPDSDRLRSSEWRIAGIELGSRGRLSFPVRMVDEFETAELYEAPDDGRPGRKRLREFRGMLRDFREARLMSSRVKSSRSGGGVAEPISCAESKN